MPLELQLKSIVAQVKVKQHTQPVMQLLNPSRPSVFYWGIQEDDLILYPDFVDNRLDSHMGFHELHTPTGTQSTFTQTKKGKQTFSSFILLSPLLLFIISLNGPVSRRIAISSSVRSNSVHQTWMICVRRWSKMASIRLSSSATQ